MQPYTTRAASNNSDAPGMANRSSLARQTKNPELANSPSTSASGKIPFEANSKNQAAPVSTSQALPSHPSTANETRSANFDPFAGSSARPITEEASPVITETEEESPPRQPARAVIRGQTPGYAGQPQNAPTPGTGDYLRYPMRSSGAPITRAQGDPQTTYPPYSGTLPPPMGTGVPLTAPENYAPMQPDQTYDSGPILQPFNQPSVPVDVFVEEARTGRFMFGAGVNSDLGVTGQIIIDERNFDPFRVPTSWEDVINGTAWRGAGQGLRVEAMPGSQVHRYLVTHTVPYLYLPGIPEPFVLSTSGFFYTRRYFDWDEQRFGGRVALGYRLTPDLSLTGSVRGENVKIFEPRVVGLVPQLDRVLGNNDLFSGRLSLTHDTRDNAFLATQGHMIELAFEQTFGAFDYPRGELDYRQYFLMRERPDGSGRHTLAYSFRVGVSGTDTPIFENFYSGGYSTMRGFDFRGASPVGPAGVQIGGQFRALGSVEYFFPITADDMIKGVVFCDFGTTEEHIEFHPDNYRVAPGFGLRINIPAMGPAPLALDLAVPVVHAPGDNIQNFSFFFGFSR